MIKLALIFISMFFLSMPPAFANPLCDVDNDNTIGIAEVISALQQNNLKNVITALQIIAGISPAPYPAWERYNLLASISHWFYYLDFEPTEAIINAIENSTYDMVVIEPIFTDKENTNFEISSVVNRFHNAIHPKLVIAYVDIGQAEDWRTYWQEGWGIGNPSWIVANDPDGWEGCYPVAYWHTGWKDIWLGPTGYIQQLLDAGFDGIYLDWVEAYSDENVLTAAATDGIDTEAEMIIWVAGLAAFGRNINPNFIVIGQNAAELGARDDYLTIIDAIAQEQTWFDGAADNTPPGNCPLPATENDIETISYENSLKDIDTALNQTADGCYTMYVDFPESTLHVSSEMYVEDLTNAHDKCEVIFTIDYATTKNNINTVYSTSRNLGFKPFISVRNLDMYVVPVP